MKQEFRISRKNYIGSYICAVFFCWTIVVPLIVVIYTEVNVRATKYIVDKDSITYYYKFLVIKEKKISKKDITDISLTQGLIQRYFKIGNLHINTAGTHLMEMVWIGVENPEKVRELIK